MIPKRKKTDTQHLSEVENCFQYLKSNIVDEFISFFKKFNIFKNEILQPSLKNTHKHYSKQLIGHLERHFVFL